MQAKEIKKDIYDIDALIDERFGKEGTPERAEAEERAYTFYTGAIIEEARKRAKISKAELARRLGTDRAYITRIESGQIEPKVSTFYRIAAALGCSVGLITPIGWYISRRGNIKAISPAWIRDGFYALQQQEQLKNVVIAFLRYMERFIPIETSEQQQKASITASSEKVTI